jgi:D-alanyl-D-alanine carboxypeptidase
MASNDPVAGFGLDPEFADSLRTLLAKCKSLGLDFRVSQGLRTPQTQAQYYCKWDQRSPKDIDKVVKTMQAAGAPWLASILHDCRDVPRQKAWVSSQLPGSGWHQWGEAADCYCFRKGKMVEDGNDPCYKQYAEAAKALGLTPGLFFSHPDAGHVQKRKQAGATNVFKWPRIDEIMKARFSGKPALVA